MEFIIQLLNTFQLTKLNLQCLLDYKKINIYIYIYIHTYIYNIS